MDISSVSNATANSTASRATLSENFDTFLTLLTTQLSNQDPLDPVDSNQFTQQLVQYSQVEQQIQTNESLDALLGQSKSAAGSTALTYLGRTALFEAANLTLGADGARWSYSLEDAAAEAKLVVLDGSGRAVASFQGERSAGAHTFRWDGKLANGADAPDGVYRLEVNAKDADGQAIGATIEVEEVINGVDFTTDTPSIFTATGVRSFDAVKTIRQ
jgi:flagellar basal-body rod modification protein FlgD